MLTASTETTTAPRIGSRQPQTRDAKQSPTGFASLVDDNAAAKADSSRQQSARDTSAAQRPTAPDKPRDSSNGDDRTAPKSDQDGSSIGEATNAAPAADGKTVSPGDKPAKTPDQATSSSATGDTPQAPNDIASANAALVLPDAATPVPQPTLAGPVAVAMPLVAAAVPLAIVAAQTPAPLAIAAAGIATANAAGKPADKVAETKSPAVAAVTTDASDQAATPTPEVTADIIPEPAAGVAAKTATVAVPVGVPTGTEAAPAMPDAPQVPAAPQAPDAEKTIGNSPLIADGAAKPAASPHASTAAAKPKPVATDADAAPAPASPAQPHEHLTAAATSVTTTLDTSPVAQQPVTHTTAAAAASPTAQLTATVATAAPVPLNGLAVELASRAQSGSSRFEIRLDPAELGRIDVRIDIDRDGQVKSHLTVEKPETLAMLRQDSPQLQRALNDAGLKTTDSSLQFSLGDQSQPRQNTSGGEQQTQRFIIRDDETVPSIAPVRSYGRATAARSGVDISV